MRLTPLQIEQTLGQTEFEQVPEEGRLAPELSSIFGEHTFFLGNTGLHIVDAAEPDEAGRRQCRIVKLASWIDSRHTQLAPHTPEFTDVVIDLAA